MLSPGTVSDQKLTPDAIRGEMENLRITLLRRSDLTQGHGAPDRHRGCGAACGHYSERVDCWKRRTDLASQQTPHGSNEVFLSRNGATVVRDLFNGLHPEDEVPKDRPIEVKRTLSNRLLELAYFSCYDPGDISRVLDKAQGEQGNLQDQEFMLLLEYLVGCGDGEREYKKVTCLMAAFEKCHIDTLDIEVPLGWNGGLNCFELHCRGRTRHTLLPHSAEGPLRVRLAK